MEDVGSPRPLILAYLIVGLGVAALYGALSGRSEYLAFGAVFGYLFAIVHSVAFFIRSRRRREPAVLLGASRTILAATLAAVAVVAVGNCVVAMVFLGGASEAEAPGAFAWAVVMLVLAWRVWLRPTARRAAVLQLIAVFFAGPGILGSLAGAVRDLELPRSAPGRVIIDTALFVTFTVLGAAGPVLDKLFWSLRDREPAVVPEAIVHV